MKLSCTFCGKTFTITAQQLGTRGKCPHCRATIILPKATPKNAATSELSVPSLWMERWFSVLGAIFLHVLVLVILALIPYQYLPVGDKEEGDEVIIGQLTTFSLVNEAENQLQQEQANADSDARHLETFSDEMISPRTTDPRLDQSFDVQLLSPSSGRRTDFDLRALQSLDDQPLGTPEFQKLVSRLKQDGLEIVITFDSTGSMDREIQEVKNKIERIGSVLFRMIPKTRISVCTYRDRDLDAKYVVKGLRLTDNLGDVINFLEDVTAAGGGDDQKAVDAGLNWAITENQFRQRAQKIILLFGDAPPHAAEKDDCLRMAADFRRKYRGVVSTVTCHSEQRLPSFVEIAQMGGGEAFLTRDEEGIVTQLVVLVFGSQHRDKVIEAFNLLQR